MQVLEPSNVALNGVHLIEASAGTGKTYTITGLYVRLLLERSLRPEQILVVTFTEAATKELKERIRIRLVNALSVLLGDGHDLDDDFLREHIAQYRNDAKALAVLVNAVRSIELAAIHTIHGFCNRLLEECAFESGARFESEFMSDDSEILQQIIDDFWRIRAPGWDSIVTGYLYAIGCSADSLYRDLGDVIRRTIAYGRQTVLVPTYGESAGFEEMITRLGLIWEQEHNDILAGLNSGSLSQARTGYCLANIESWGAVLDRYFHDRIEKPLPVAALMRFSAGELKKHTKKKKETPEHLFFNEVESLIDRLEQNYQAIRAACIEYGVNQLPARKKQKGVMAFDDLLLDVRNSLRAPGAGKLLAQKLRLKYPAALIDEFQDTDPIQFEIFQTVYQAPDCCLFLIGDPKQAIYSFRGADIFAYLKAAKTSANRYTLDTNYRSETLLIKAINGLFQSHDNPFVFKEIQFYPVHPSHKTDEVLMIEDDKDRPLTIWHFEEQSNRSDAKQRIARALASKIMGLLGLGRQGKAMLGSSPLAASDIAVLVRSHHDGEIIRRSLLDRGVRSVVYSQESIYASSEAWELQLLLEGVCNSWNGRKLSTALTTSLLGRTVMELCDLEKDEQAWEEIADRFAVYYRLWKSHGFSAMLHHLLQHEGVYERLAMYHDTERRLTNLRHLMDLLQKAVHSEGFGPSDLTTWLQAKSREAQRIEDEEQLRLESDEHLIKIVTIHKSKGLEYPIVFYPFLWDSSRFRKSKAGPVAVFHDDEKALRIDLGTENIEQHRHLQQVEMLAEELRLLYVALTRARNRCYISWGRVKSGHALVSADSALGYLLFPSRYAGNRDAGMPDQSSAKLSNDAFLKPLETYAAKAKEAVGLLPLPEAGLEDFAATASAMELEGLRYFERRLTGIGIIHSFSALQYQASHNIEEPDYDAEAGILKPRIQTVKTMPDRSLFSFPRGRRAGSCLHAILEDLDFFRAQEESSVGLVAGWLRRFGFDEEWTGPVMKGIRDILATSLDVCDQELSLARLSREQRLDELEFYYPVPMMSHEELRALFFRHIGDSAIAARLKQISNQKCSLECGFMKGFIDLVLEWQGKFYIVDYKSNHLGDTFESYHQERLSETIAEAGYDLQYYIYTVALHRYLKQRFQEGYDYDRHMGGVYYLFIRGMSPENGCRFGVYRDRPAKGIIESLDGSLAFS